MPSNSPLNKLLLCTTSCIILVASCIIQCVNPSLWLYNFTCVEKGMLQMGSFCVLNSVEILNIALLFIDATKTFLQMLKFFHVFVLIIVLHIVAKMSKSGNYPIVFRGHIFLFIGLHYSHFIKGEFT